MELLVVQLVSLGILFLGTFLFGCLPILIFRLNQRRTTDEGGGISAFLVYFGGGVLFSTAMLHLLPEAQQQLAHSHGNASTITSHPTGNIEQTAHSHEHSLPLAELVVLAGFFVTYLIEVILHLILDRRSRDQSYETRTTTVKFCSCSQRTIECSRIYKPADGGAKRKRSATWAGHSTELSNQTHKCESRETPPDLLRSTIITHQFPSYGSIMANDSDHLSSIRRTRPAPKLNRTVSVPPQLPRIAELQNSESSSTVISFGSIMTVVALSFHSVFEGLAIGFQKSTVGTWTMLLAIATHKFIIASAIGMEAIVDGSRESWIVCSMFIFAAMSPIGMSIAISLDSVGKHLSDNVVGIMNCLATGTLLYVTFFEVFPRKSKSSSCDPYRFWGMFTGSMVMAALQYATTVI